MLPVTLTSVRQILCLGAHADDIEIGCGGTLLSLLRYRPEVSVHWIVFSANETREAEARASAGRFLDGVKFKEITIHRFRDGFFPYEGSALKDLFERLKSIVSPDLVFTHYGQDLHQDHRVVSELTWNTFRDHLILEYEVPKYDGGMGSPNVFMPLGTDDLERKLRYLRECFLSQSIRPWFDESTFRSLMRLRGIECNAQSTYAEGFYARKVCLGER